MEGDKWVTWSQDRAERFAKNVLISLLPVRREEEQARTREIREELKGQGYWKETEPVTPPWGHCTSVGWSGCISQGQELLVHIFMPENNTLARAHPAPPIHTVSSLLSMLAEPDGSQKQAVV